MLILDILKWNSWLRMIHYYFFCHVLEIKKKRFVPLSTIAWDINIEIKYEDKTVSVTVES